MSCEISPYRLFTGDSTDIDVALDNDGDSQMHSSLTSSVDDLMTSDKPLTPLAQQFLPQGTADLSPPNSQGVPLPSASVRRANANGKRPLSTIDGNGDAPPAPRSAQVSSTTEPPQIKTHEPSGYSWVKPEDEPGWAWKNKRAVDEANRAYDGLLMKDQRIGGKCCGRARGI